MSTTGGVNPVEDAVMSIPTNNIDPMGDIIFEVGEQRERIRVSSKVLALVSPVFTAMLQSGFKESVGAGITPATPTIPLPEDDSQAFTLLARVIHHQLDHVPLELDIISLEKLACLCDKYGCTIAMVFCGTLWLERCTRVAQGVELNRLLLVSYLLDLPDLFSDISWKILQAQKGPVDSLPGLTDHPLVHHFFIGRLTVKGSVGLRR